MPWDFMPWDFMPWDFMAPWHMYVGMYIKKELIVLIYIVA